MQNLSEGCLDVAVYCFKINSYKGSLDIHTECMLLYKAIKTARIKELNTVNQKVGFFSSVVFVVAKPVL
jgi:hypothetical protein